MLERVNPWVKFSRGSQACVLNEPSFKLLPGAGVGVGRCYLGVSSSPKILTGAGLVTSERSQEAEPGEQV